MSAQSTGTLQRRNMGRTPCLFEAEAVRERLLDEVHFYLAYSYKVYGARVTLSHAREPCQARFLSWVTGRSGIAVHSKFSSMRRHAWKSPSSRRHRTQDTVNSTVSEVSQWSSHPRGNSKLWSTDNRYISQPPIQIQTHTNTATPNPIQSNRHTSITYPPDPRAQNPATRSALLSIVRNARTLRGC